MLKTRRSLRFEKLEERTTPSASMTILREVTGPDAATIQAAVDAFRADLGANNGATAGSLGKGRREITWDSDSALDPFASPNNMPAEFYNADIIRGAVVTSVGLSGSMVSQDDNTVADPDPDLVKFSDINVSYATAFATFSGQRLYSGRNNVVDVRFYIPGTEHEALVNGFGAIFTDVDTSSGASIHYFDRSGGLLLARDILPTPGDGSLSFLGVKFDVAAIARVRIVSGKASIASATNDITQGGASDLVVMDNFIYGEPVNPFTVVAGDVRQAPFVRVYAPDGSLRGEIVAFNPTFRGGVRVATGDVNGDRTADIIVGAGPGTGLASGPNVKVFDGNSLGQLASFFAYTGNFRQGVFVAGGDVNNDRQTDVIVSGGRGSKVPVKVIDGTKLEHVDPVTGVIDNDVLLGSFFAFGPKFTGGVHVAAGDFNVDSLTDVIVAPQSGKGQVKVVSGGLVDQVETDGTIKATSLLSSFFAFSPKFTGGVSLATGDFNNDGRDEIVVGAAKGLGHFKIVNPVGITLLPDNQVAAGSLLHNFVATDRTFRGVRLATSDLNADGVADIIVGAGPGKTNQVRVLNGATFASPGLAELDSFFAFDPTYRGGLFVAGG